MIQRKLMKGNEAMSDAAVQAGCKFYAGYPITPQNEVTEYLAKRMPQADGVFVQAESELAAVNMVFGAAATGIRSMTSSSSPGISLKQEGISYIAAAELPCLIANIMRGGPGLGNITGSQGDYFQATRGGGHGDYRLIVLAPNSVQEMYDLTLKGFDLADRYRNPVMLLADGVLGQMAEPIEIRKHEPLDVKKEWALTGCKGRIPNIVKTLYLNPENGLEKHNIALEKKYDKIKEELSLSDKFMCDDANIMIISYGVASRIAKEAIKKARKEGIKVGLFRPISLWPFPSDISKICPKNVLVLEMSNGQMIEDVKLSLFDAKKDTEVDFMGIGGGWIPRPEDVLEKIKEINER